MTSAIGPRVRFNDDNLLTCPLTPTQIVSEVSLLKNHLKKNVLIRPDQEKLVIYASKLFHSREGVGSEADAIRNYLSNKELKNFSCLITKDNFDTCLEFKSIQDDKIYSVNTNELFVSLISDVFDKFIHNTMNLKRVPLDGPQIDGPNIDNKIMVTVSPSQIKSYASLVKFLQGITKPEAIDDCRSMIQTLESVLTDTNVKGIDLKEVEQVERQHLLKLYNESSSLDNILEPVIFALKYNLLGLKGTCEAIIIAYCLENDNLEAIICELEEAINDSELSDPLKKDVAEAIFQAIAEAVAYKMYGYLKERNIKEARQLKTIMAQYPDKFLSFTINAGVLDLKSKNSLAYYLPQSTQYVDFTHVGHIKFEKINMFANRLPNLRGLTISGASYKKISLIKVLSIKALHFHKCQKLKKLSGTGIYIPNLRTFAITDSPLLSTINIRWEQLVNHLKDENDQYIKSSLLPINDGSNGI